MIKIIKYTPLNKTNVSILSYLLQYFVFSYPYVTFCFTVKWLYGLGNLTILFIHRQVIILAATLFWQSDHLIRYPS